MVEFTLQGVIFNIVFFFVIFGIIFRKRIICSIKGHNKFHPLGKIYLRGSYDLATKHSDPFTCYECARCKRYISTDDYEVMIFSKY